MSGLDPESMKIEQDDRPIGMENKKKRPKYSHPFNRKTLILILAIVILLMIGITLLFREPKTASHVEDNVVSENSLTPVENEKRVEQMPSTMPSNYQNINAPAISSTPTETQVATPQYKEYLEIPGEVTDKIVALEAAKQTNTIKPVDNPPVLQLKSQPVKTNTKFNELPLKAQIEVDHYTIQLSGSSTLQSLLNFAKKHNLTNYQIYETKRNKQAWFVLIKGNYPTKSDAQAALKALPAELKIDKPWVKIGESVRKDKL
ncbi:SPOR domain-containing protein [Utexia brackfieldae]|uniref:SPOR domain-containing protein n=1 Tax=Utexia brackfieldae TaxID=3074108 RepID=UPI00370DC8C8